MLKRLTSNIQHPASIDDTGSPPVVKKRLSLFTSLKLTDRERERLRVLLLFLFLNEIASHPLFDVNLACRGLARSEGGGLLAGPPLPLLLGVLLTLEGRYEEAILRFERELALNPRNASAYRALGILYLNHRKTPRGPSAISGDFWSWSLKEPGPIESGDPSRRWNGL